MKKVALWVLATVWLVAACWAQVPATVAEQSVIKVGVVLPLSGPHSKFGEIEKNSFLLGLGEINAAGGVRGRSIELIFEDDGSKFDRGRAAAEELIAKDNVLALTGGVFVFGSVCGFISRTKTSDTVLSDHRLG